MKYRTLGRTGMKVSEIGLGCEHLEKKPYETVEAVIKEAANLQVNILDVFMSEPQVRSDIGKAIKGMREKFIIQGHFGAIWKDGQYARSREWRENKIFFDDLLTRLQTDYMDIGMIHFIDSEEDYKSVFDTEVMEQVVSLRDKGIIRSIGLSSHNPLIAKRAVETGLIDVLMFSINPAHDLMPPETIIDDYFNTNMLKRKTLSGIEPARTALYTKCEETGCSITVMKTYSGGMLLHKERSPFGMALSPYACIQYALTRPAVSSVLIGCATAEEMQKAAAFENAGEEEKDFSHVFGITPLYSAKGRCMYCNHCLPCASRIDIAQVNKYLDLAVDFKSGTVAEHYKALSAHAGDCAGCGECEPRCPFDVPVRERMAQAKEVFGL